MLSYRKLAMRVLGRPLHTGGGNDSPRPASQRAAAFILTAAMLTTLTAPAFAKEWYIEEGDITVRAGETEGTNKVSQGENPEVEDTNTVITNRDKDKASSNTVTIEAENEGDKVEVTLKDLNIDASRGSEAAVSVTGKGDTNIELNGDNKLKSGAGHAGLEHNKTDTSGELTIQDKDKNGSLEAVGGFKGAGIGSAGSNDAQVKITGGNITATSDDDWGAGIGSGSDGNGTDGTAYVEITGGEINATGGYLGAGIGGGCNGSGNVTISGGTITAAGGEGAAGIGGGYYNGATVTITGDAVIKNASSTKYGAGIGGWGLDEAVENRLGIDPQKHKEYLYHFYEGNFPGSWAKGELYNYDPATGDARSCGTTASLCGVEQALEKDDKTALDYAVKRDLLLHTAMAFLQGFPMLNCGDEIAQLNGWDYKNDPDRVEDSRNLHRSKFNWEDAKQRTRKGTLQNKLWQGMEQLRQMRADPCFAPDAWVTTWDSHNPGVLALVRKRGEETLVGLFNFTEYPAGASLDALGGKYHTPEGTSVWLADAELEPYQALLIKNK